MFAKAEWFSPRKFGWGLGIKSWHGAAYIVALIAIFVAIGFLPISGEYRTIVMALAAIVFTIDVLTLMPKVYAKLDEREQKHQLIAERNAAFVAVAFMVFYLAFVSASLAARGAGQGEMIAQLGPLFALVLLMAVVKGGTLLMLERES